MRLTHLIILLMALLLVACGGTEASEPTTEATSETDALSDDTGAFENTAVPTEPTVEIVLETVTDEQDEVEGITAVINLDAFNSAALVQDPTIVDCTLTDGSPAQCAQLIVKYLPDNFEIGPNCPETLADVGGIWDWDGENPGLYSLNEAFWLMLNEQGFAFYDEDGNINIEDPGSEGPNAVLEGNNCIEIALDETAEVTALIPLNPVMAETPTQLGVVSQVGMSLSGIPIFSDAPSVFRTNNMPALDPCGGHVDPGGWWHWHATATDMESTFAHEGVEADCYLDQSASALFAYAFDGYPIYGSADADGTVPTDLDDCNGHTGATAEYPDGIYHYHATLDFPNLPTCLAGTRAENGLSSNTDTAVPDGNAAGGRGEDGPPAGAPPGGGEGGPPGGGPPAGDN